MTTRKIRDIWNGWGEYFGNPKHRDHMPNLTNEENWAARERLRRVEFLLWWRGWVGRQDLVEVFGISPAQASGDLQRYAGLNAGAMIYQTSRKRYEAVEGMACVLHEPVFEEAVRVFLGDGPARPVSRMAEDADPRLEVLGLPERRVDVRIARRVLLALLERRKLRARYVSVSSGDQGWRVLAPGGLAWGGGRWHVRAWCGKNGEWRDFVLGRFADAEWPVEPAGELPEDAEWLAIEVLRLRLNPELPEEKRAGLRMDYGLAGDVLEIRVRKAMKDYLLANLFIGEGGHAELPRHFVVE